MVRVSRQKNGLTVVTAAMPHMASISLGIWVGIGGRFEPAALSGASHFIEHILFKGTRRRSAKQISQDIEGVGGYLNAFTTEENTCFYSKACAHRFTDLLEVLMDMFLNSSFAPVEIDKERNVIKEELAMYLDQPHHQVQELLNEAMWPDHPLGRSLTGTVQTLDAMSRPDLLGFQRANYLSGTTVVAAAGNLDHELVSEAVFRSARKMASGKRPVFQPAPNKQSEPRLHLFSKPTEQTQIALGIRTCSRHDERRFALRLLSTLLGENMSSRLFQVVREDHGLAYSISSSLAFFDDVGVFNVSAGLETDSLLKAVQLILRELHRVTASPPSAAELRRARDYVIGQLDLSLENTESQMMWIGEQLLAYGRTFTPAEIKQYLLAVRPSEIQAVARKFIRPERMSLALVSPRKESGELLDLLRR